MNLNYDIPQKFKSILEKYFSKEEILVSVPADISEDNMYTSGMLIITDKNIIYFKEDASYKSYEINSGKNYKATIYVGNGLLEAEFDDEPVAICRFSMDHAPKYATIVKELNKAAAGEEFEFESSEPDKRCPNCGRILRHGSNVCVKCVKKFDTFKKLIKLIDKKYYPLMFLCLILMIASSALAVVGPYLYRLLVDKIFIPVNKDYSLFATLICGIVAIQVVSTMMEIYRGRKTTIISNSIAHDLRLLVFSKIEKLSMSFISKKKTGDLMHRVSHDTIRIRSFLQNEFIFLFSQIITLIAVLIIMFAMSWEMALFILLPTPAMIFVMRLFRKKMRRIYRIQWRLSSKANAILQDILSGMRIVKAFGKEKNEVLRYRKASRDFSERVKYNERFWATMHPLLMFVLNIGTYLIYLYGGYKIIGRELQLGELIQFTQYAGIIYGPLGYMTRLPKIIADTMAAAGRVFEILDEEFEIYNKETAVKLDIKGEVIFDKVSFGYKSYLPVLHDISVHVKPGEMIGLVGHSGSGKSTFINLLMRFYDADDGRIFIDGVNVKNIDQNDFRRQIGVVLQETYLFTGTIRDNIAFSKPDATDEEIIAAAKIANAHDFIIKMPDGYNTKIGERGQTLSGGEKQRIAIARAIIHNPKILILDEATSSLDTDTENLIQEALARLVKNRTTFAIAHRLATLKNANRLIVLNEGNLVEMGTHEELMAKKGIYYNLVLAQRKMTRMHDMKNE